VIVILKKVNVVLEMLDKLSHYHPAVYSSDIFKTSSTALTKATGFSCGRLWPAFVIIRCSRIPVNFDALNFPSVGALNPSLSPSSVIVGRASLSLI